MYDIGARVGIEGESQFRAQISRINKDYKSMESYLQTLDKAMERNGRSMEALQAAVQNGANAVAIGLGPVHVDDVAGIDDHNHIGKDGGDGVQ